LLRRVAAHSLALENAAGNWQDLQAALIDALINWEGTWNAHA
jgi:hypothetical protein